MKRNTSKQSTQTTFFFLFFFPIFLLGQSTSESIDSVALREGTHFHQKGIRAFEQQKIDSTVVYLEQAVNCYRRAGADSVYLNELNTLTTLLYMNEEYEKYFEVASLTLEEVETRIGKGSLEYAFALNNLMSYHYTRGDYRQSLVLLREALAILKRLEAPSSFLAQNYHNQANSYIRLGDQERALQLLDKNRQLLEQEKKPPAAHQFARIFNSTGEVYLLSHRLEEAQREFEQGLALLDKETGIQANQQKIRALHELCKIAMKQQRLDAAEHFLQKSKRLQQGKQAFRKSFGLELEGKLWMARGEPARALEAYERSTDLMKASSGQMEASHLARRYLRQAQALQALDRGAESLQQCQEGLQLLSPTFASTDPAENPAAIDILYKETGLDLLRLKAQLFVQFFEQTQEVAHLSKAMTAYRTASEVIGLWRQSVPTAAAKNELAERSSVLYQEAIRTAYRLYEQGKEEQYKDLAFSLAERSKAQLLIELMNERLARGLHNLPDSLLEQDRKLRLDISLCNRQLLKASMQTDETQAEDLTSWRNRRFELQQQLEQLSRQFEANYPDFYQLKYQQEPTDPAVLQKLLADQEQALIEYFMGEEAIYVFVLTARQRELLRLPLSDSLDRQIERLRAAISQIPSDADLADNHRNFTQSAYSLYQQVLASALSTLPTGLASLVIIPDYQLNYLPFELLLERPAAEGTVQFSPAVLDYVLEKYQVSYDYSAVVYGKNCQKESGAYQRDFVGFAPTFGEPTIAELRRGCTLGDLGALQCNGEEVTRIGKLMGGQISLGEQANRAQFEDLLLGSRIVHLATHACVKEDRGGHNKIFLSDDYVSENDLFGRLTNAELIVLSACNSGSGQLLRGEGVMSLARGFLQAGSASCVLSRWSVDDCATSEIMTRLYEGLQAGQTRTEALRGAKLAFVESAEKYQQHPFFWGAFILYGRADRLSLYSSGWPWHRYLLLCLLLGMLGLGWARFRR